jgi:hypothetical protein
MVKEVNFVREYAKMAGGDRGQSTNIYGGARGVKLTDEERARRKAEKDAKPKRVKKIKIWYKSQPVPEGYREATPEESIFKKKVFLWGLKKIPEEYIDERDKDMRIEQKYWNLRKEVIRIQFEIKKINKMKEDKKTPEILEKLKNLQIELRKTFSLQEEAKKERDILEAKKEALENQVLQKKKGIYNIEEQIENIIIENHNITEPQKEEVIKEVKRLLNKDLQESIIKGTTLRKSLKAIKPSTEGQGGVYDEETNKTIYFKPSTIVKKTIKPNKIDLKKFENLNKIFEKKEQYSKLPFTEKEIDKIIKDNRMANVITSWAGYLYIDKKGNISKKNEKIYWAIKKIEMSDKTQSYKKMWDFYYNQDIDIQRKIWEYLLLEVKRDRKTLLKLIKLGKKYNLLEGIEIPPIPKKKIRPPEIEGKKIVYDSKNKEYVYEDIIIDNTPPRKEIDEVSEEFKTMLNNPKITLAELKKYLNDYSFEMSEYSYDEFDEYAKEIEDLLSKHKNNKHYQKIYQYFEKIVNKLRAEQEAWDEQDF